MKKQIEIIRGEFRRSDEARYIHRLHGVLLVLLGLSTVKAGKLLGDPQRTIAHWLAQFKKRGIEGLRDAERAGRPQKLNRAQRKALSSALAKSPKEVGLEADVWTAPLIASLLSKRYGVALNVRTYARLLRAFKDTGKIQ